MNINGSLVGFLPTQNIERARAFFEKTLGLPVLSDDGFAVVFEAGGNKLRVVRVDHFTPQPFTVVGWEVEDIEAAVRTLAARRVSFLRVGQLPQDAHGIWTAPGGDRVAWFSDPDGNTLSLSQSAART